MKLQLNTLTAAQPISAGAPVVKPPEAAPGAEDGIGISSASAALAQLAANRSTKLERVTASVQAGLYQISSAETSSALVSAHISDALSGRN